MDIRTFRGVIIVIGSHRERLDLSLHRISSRGSSIVIHCLEMLCLGRRYRMVRVLRQALWPSSARWKVETEGINRMWTQATAHMGELESGNCLETYLTLKCRRGRARSMSSQEERVRVRGRTGDGADRGRAGKARAFWNARIFAMKLHVSAT